MDLFAEFCEPLPSAIFLSIMGLPRTDLPGFLAFTAIFWLLFMRWVDLIWQVDPSVAGSSYDLSKYWMFLAAPLTPEQVKELIQITAQ